MTPTRPPHSPVGRQILGIISAMVLSVVVPLLLHEATGGSTNPRNPWWSTAIIAVSGVAYAGVIAAARRQLFAMVLWLFTYVFMGLAPFVQYRLDVPPGTTPGVDEGLYPAAAAVVLVSSVATLIGARLARRAPARQAARTHHIDPVRANMLAAAGVALFLYYGSKIGFGSFIISRNELGALREAVWANPATAALLTGSLHMVLLVAFLAQMAVRYQRKAAGLRPHILPALITGALLLYAVNPISGARYLVGTVYLAMLACFGVYATMRRFRIMAVAAPIGLLTLFPLADAFRNTLEADITIEGPIEAMLSGDFDAFAQLTNTLTYVEAEGLAWGWQLLGVFLFWVPRSMWPGKPIDTGVLIAEWLDYDFTNLSSPIWSEFYINFGWAGTVIGMGLLGYLFRRLDHRTEHALRFSPVPPVVVCATTFYLLILLRGSLLNAASSLLVILLASWFVRRRQPRKAAPARHPQQAQAGPSVVTVPAEPRNFSAPPSV